MKLIGEGEYNLDNLKEIEVTDSYLGLTEKIRECQNKEPLQNCTSKLYTDTILRKCGCLPLNMIVSNQVSIFYLYIVTW